jgi:small subunit ribosomal protein S16
MFRLVVQESRRTPTSGKVAAYLGSYDPHSKAVTLNKERAQFYLDHGAQPSHGIVRLLDKEGVKLPKWVTASPSKERVVRNADKRRSTRPEKLVETESKKPSEQVVNEETAETQEKAEETKQEIAGNKQAEAATPEASENTDEVKT